MEEEQQCGKKRAGYGEALLADLAERLSQEFGKGWSARQLEYCRSFYLSCPLLIVPEKSNAVRSISADPLAGNAARIANAVRANLSPVAATPEPHLGHGAEIGYAVRSQSERVAASANHTIRIPHALRGEFPDASIVHAGRSTSPDAWRPGLLHPHLSWTHYRTLLRVSRSEARDFYEIEAIRNAWSARELERQINSLLFERLAKSRDKKGLLRLATRGHNAGCEVQ